MNARWKFEGFDGHDPIFEGEAVMSEARARQALKMLAARYLDEREIIEDLANGSTLDRVKVRIDQGGGVRSLSCGSDPWFTASVVKDLHKR